MASVRQTTPTRSDSTGEEIRLDSNTDRKTLDEDPCGPEAIAESFSRLTKNVFDLDSRLQVLLDACRQLGRSYDLVVAAQALRGELDGFLTLFYHNAMQLSPLVKDPGQVVKQFARDKFNKESLSDQLESMATAFKILRGRLNEFREYTAESIHIKSLMESFTKDLKYRAMCFREHTGQSNSTHFRMYVHSVANELSNELAEIVTSFEFFNKYGIPSIRYEQKRDSEYDLNMSTMATFFSAVTATTLQAGLNSPTTTTIHSIVNTFWFCSLVLSIGAALNCLLKRATYGTHGRRLLPWVTIWMHGSAPMFLTLSIAFFSAGLVLFTYASNQKRYTSFLTLACTAVITFDLVSVSAWIVYEQWISPIFKMRSRSTKSETDKAKKLLEVNQTYPYGKPSQNDSSSDVSDTSTLADVLPIFTRAQAMLDSGIRSGIRTLSTTIDNVMQNQTHDIEHTMPAPVQQAAHNNAEPHLISLRAMSTAVHAAAQMLLRGPSHNVPQGRAPQNPMPRISRTAASPSSLVFPNQPQHILGHLLGEVHDLEYSHQGLVLAVASFDHVSKFSTTVLYDEIETNIRFTSHHRHRQGRMIKQVAWSPCDNMLLVRLDDTIDLLNVGHNLEQEWTIRRPHLIRSAAWCTSSDILFVEGSFVVKLSLDGHTVQVTFKHRFDNFLPRDIVVVPDTDLLLLVGRIIFKDMPLPKNTKAESQLRLFDMKQSRVCDSNPVLDDMRHITLADNISSARNGFDVLVGHKNNRSPQVWRLTLDQLASNKLQPASVRLQPFNEFSGPGYFAGDQQQMIACVGDDDSIRIWDRESGAIVHNVPAAQIQIVEGSRRAVAWSAPQEKTVRFATAGDKELRFWSAVQDNPILLRQNPPDIAIPDGQELAVTEETPPPGHGTTDLYIHEIDRAIARGQDRDTVEIVNMNGDSEKAGQGTSTPLTAIS